MKEVDEKLAAQAPEAPETPALLINRKPDRKKIHFRGSPVCIQAE